MTTTEMLADLLSCAREVMADDDGKIGEVEMAEIAQHMSMRLGELDEAIRTGKMLPDSWARNHLQKRDCCCSVGHTQGEGCCPGWIHGESGHGMEIQRCDECRIFADDDDALAAHDRDCGCPWVKLDTRECFGCGQDLISGANEDCSHPGGCGTMNGSNPKPAARDLTYRCEPCRWTGTDPLLFIPAAPNVEEFYGCPECKAPVQKLCVKCDQLIEEAQLDIDEPERCERCADPE